MTRAIFGEKETLIPRPEEAYADRAHPPSYIEPITRKEMDAKLAAATARNEAFEHRVDASLARMEAKLRHLPSTLAMVATAASAAAATIGIIIGVLAFGGDRFDSGVQVSTNPTPAASEALAISKQNAQQIQLLAGQVDAVLTAIKASQTGAPDPPSAPQQ